MADRNLRWPGLAPLASVGVGCLALLSAVNPAAAYADVSTLIMGGTGDPDPDETYLTDVYNAYIMPNIAPQTAIPTGLVTPEQGFPLTAGLTFDSSVAWTPECYQPPTCRTPTRLFRRRIRVSRST
jgi:hypothetical protein